MSKVIEINNLSKIYDLGLVGTGTLSKDLNRKWAKLRGKPDPYATLVELNDRTQKSSTNMIYALKDINFSVEQGEVLGIIGKNGAGKSTLLKILSQITSPSTGTIKMKGRVASLLEVGTGMHPEMTARQNIYLNGSLMGMRRHEITSKLDEIVDFAGIEKYIDTPTKRFSSGMTVRLGFAIAAFLDPEILIVDEVLAVGDAEFQKKAIGKMQDVSKGEGRTVLFVSHNMVSVKKLCSKAIILEHGTVTKSGDVEDMVSYYLKGGSAQSDFGSIPKNHPRHSYHKNMASFKSIQTLNEECTESNVFYRGENIIFKLKLDVLKKITNCSLLIRIGSDEVGDILYASASNDDPKGIDFNIGHSEIEITASQNLLPGIYWTSISLMDKDGYPFDSIQEFGTINIENISSNLHPYPWGRKLASVWNKTINLKINEK